MFENLFDNYINIFNNFKDFNYFYRKVKYLNSQSLPNQIYTIFYHKFQIIKYHRKMLEFQWRTETKSMRSALYQWKSWSMQYWQASNVCVCEEWGSHDEDGCQLKRRISNLLGKLFFFNYYVLFFNNVIFFIF